MKANARRRFEAADRAVMRAAEQIERAVADLLATIDRFAEHVARQYVVELLADVLLERNPQAIDAFKHLTGDVTLQLTNALMDWRDEWGKR
jgi:uncharacterized protein YydD (DUF2326 family)